MGRKRKDYREWRVGGVLIRMKLRDPRIRPGVATAETFAGGLNKRGRWARQILHGDRYMGRIYGAWCAVHAILSASLRDGKISRENGVLSPESVRRFRRFSAAAPIRLDVTEEGGPMIGAPPGGDEARAEIIHMLWELIESRARDRLKVCRNPKCGKWFADKMKNGGGVYCSASSTSCKDRSWNRPRRRAAGHRQYRARPTRGSRGSS